MPNENQPKIVNSRANPKIGTELNIESIISAPLVAASKANVMMLTGQARFLLDYCFTKEGDIYKPVMITMTLSRGVANPDKKPEDADYIHVTEMAFQMPLLCLLPLNSLGIDKIKVDFDLEITSIGSYQSKSSSSGIINRKAVLNGRVASQPRTSDADASYKDKLSSHLKVSINAGALPLPRGVLSVIDLYTKAIQPLPNVDTRTSDEPDKNIKNDQK